MPTSMPERLLAEGAILLAILGWWFTARGMPAFVLPGPLDVLQSLSGFVTNPTLLQHVAVSFLRVAASVTIGLLLALLLAWAATRSAIVMAIVERRILLVLNSFPSVGWAVLAIIWFQVSDLTVIFIQVAIVLPFCLVNALEGFRQLDRELDELGASLTRSAWRRFLKLTLPAIMPFLVAGLRIAYGICWKIALVSELFGAPSGLGVLLLRAQANADAAMVFAVCLVIVLIFGTVDRFALRPLAARYSANREARA
jgi:NitT/TauT family transport system permease protein/sulfonate transport system permease protein